MDSYDPGDLVLLTAAFANNSGIPTDPDTVTVTVYGPDPVAAVAATRDGTGSYSHLFQPAVCGAYAVKFVGAGAVVATQWTRFRVRDAESEEIGTRFADGAASFQSVRGTSSSPPPGVLSGYATVADLADYVPLGPTSVLPAYTTATRPDAAQLVDPGAGIFDTTLGQPIWSDGSDWVDAGGTPA